MKKSIALFFILACLFSGCASAQSSPRVPTSLWLWHLELPWMVRWDSNVSLQLWRGTEELNEAFIAYDKGERYLSEQFLRVDWEKSELALVDFSRAIEICRERNVPETSDILKMMYIQRAEVYTLLMDTPKALADLEAALALSTQRYQWIAYILLAQNYYHAGELDRAEDYCFEILDNSDDRSLLNSAERLLEEIRRARRSA